LTDIFRLTLTPLHQWALFVRASYDFLIENPRVKRTKKSNVSKKKIA